MNNKHSPYYLSFYNLVYSYFIHFYSASHSLSLSEALPAIDTVSEFTRRALQATASEGLAQGSYVTARAGVESTTLRSKCISSNNAPTTLHKTLIVDTCNKHITGSTCTPSVFV